MSDYDEIPVRLPSGTKAVVHLPRPFTLEDGVHLMNFLSSYIEEAEPAPSTLAQQVASAQAEVDVWPDGKLARVKLAGGDQP